MNSPPDKPQYKLNEFTDACKKAASQPPYGAPIAIRIDHRTVWSRAEKELGFPRGDEQKIFQAIANGAIVIKIYNDTKPKDKRPDKGEIIDSYLFDYGPYKDCYLAFYRKNQTGTFIIKSVHGKRKI